MHDTHDHSLATHSAKCDVCEYIAKTHAHDDTGAVSALCQNLAEHNKSTHNTQTNPEEIKEAVAAIMQTH